MTNHEAEGGCGVIGVACAEKIAGKHLLTSLCQMANRGNGKGGGIAAVGLSPQAFGVTQEILDNDYLIAIAYLDISCRNDVEREFIYQPFDVDHVHVMPHIPSYQSLKSIDVAPPNVVIYFCKVKKDSSNAGLTEDDIVYQNSDRLNRMYYASTGEKRAFVLSHSKNLLILKMVGYGDDVIRYYQLEEFLAHVWIGHHRYPTKGRVWHPGGAHPFIGMHEALVHNGDFANYFSICEYLAQKGIVPHFLTDTEVSVLLFDLLHRRYSYPLEYVIEALAPTTERDFTLLPKDKQHIYRSLQTIHMHGSPDGPWFFLIAQSLARHYRLIGITDTSMLRPQVFALQTGDVPIGFAASEKQAIDAALESLAADDTRFWRCADYYWNARGGSYTDGGAFSFTVTPEKNDKATLSWSDKFGKQVHAAALKPPYVRKTGAPAAMNLPEQQDLYAWALTQIPRWSYDDLNAFLHALQRFEDNDQAIAVFTQLLDGNYRLGALRRSSVKALVYEHLVALFTMLEKTFSLDPHTLVVNAKVYDSEGEHSLARAIVDMAKKGCRRFILFNCHGHRFIGNGLGPHSQAIRIDVYGSSGDYLASGIDGAEIHVHGSGQDQLAQIMKSGTLVVHGDVGQTFMYGAKGGKAFIKGNAAGRPLICTVGKPRVVINGTCLDYLAESCMAGNPLNGGGFAVVNGITFDEEGHIQELDTPYPGSNLFSLASGGAIYIRDPEEKIGEDQLNGGEFVPITEEDWALLLPYLEENTRHFDIPVSRLLHYQGSALPFEKVYRKIRPVLIRALQEEEAWVKKKD